jgi:hypothetical protein
MKNYIKLIFLSIMAFSFIISIGFSTFIEITTINDAQIEKPSGSAIAYVSKANNLTYETLLSGRMKGVAEVGQYIMINVTFSEFIEEAWFQENFTTSTPQILVNHSLTPQQFFGNKVSYIYSCLTTIPDANKCYRILVRNGAFYAASPVSQLYIKTSENPAKITNLAALNSGTGGISVTWAVGTDNVNVTHYRIYRGVNTAMDGSTCDSFFFTTVHSPYYLDTDVLEANTYYYTVKAVDGVNRNSTFADPVNLKPDTTAPTIVSQVGFSGVIGTTITITITTQEDCAYVSLVVSYGDDLLIFDPVSMTKVSTTVWRYQIDTNNFYGTIIQEGSYTLKFTLTDDFGNHNAAPYEFENGLSVNKPGLDPLVIILIIVAAGAAVGILLFVKMRGKRTVKVEAGSDEEALTRKREIYYGASSIGKRSGEAADAHMAARGKDTGTNKPVLREKKVETVSSMGKSDSMASASGKQLPSAIQMKLEEQKVSVDKKMQFLDSKVDSLISQLDILSSIMTMKKDDITCPNCDHVMGASWEVCPFCKIKDKDDELNMKKAALSLDSKKSKCPKCGLLLEASWNKCPRCYVNSQQKEN